MLKRVLGLLALVAALSLCVAACGGDDEESSGGGSQASEEPKGKVGVILPDAASSARWETADRKFLGEAFKAAGVEYDIQNANGDKAKFGTIADQMLSSGVTVLLIVNLGFAVGGDGDQEGDRSGCAGDRLRPPDVGWRRELLRVVRQRGGGHGDR